MQRQRYNRAMPKQASFIRLALYHVPQWRAPIKRNYGKGFSALRAAMALGHSANSASYYVQQCHFAHRYGLPLPAAPMLALPAPTQ